MQISKKELKLTLLEKGIDLKELYTGNILTYSGVNHSGSFIGSATTSPIMIFVKHENGNYRPLTNFLWGNFPETYMSIDQNPTFVTSIVINVKPLVDSYRENFIPTNITTLKELFGSLKTLNSRDVEKRPR